MTWSLLFWIVFIILTFIGMLYSIAVCLLAIRGWVKITWTDRTAWPFFFSKWEKRGPRGTHWVMTLNPPTFWEAVKYEVKR